MRSTTSLRLDDKLRERLSAEAQLEGITLKAIIERLLREGLAMADHPGVVLKPGPAGRRAALADGSDIWEFASALRRMSGSESERIRALAEEFSIHERQVITALNYAAAHREEVVA